MAPPLGRKEVIVNTKAALGLVIFGLLLAGCANEADDATTSAVQSLPSVTTMTVAPTTTIDAFQVETDRIIYAWIDAWKAEDAEAVADLYADDGVYADDGCPFVREGKAAIWGMVRDHMGGVKYTLVDPVEIIYTDNGAVVQWIWGGTHVGDEFAMDAQTTFEIEDGLIIRSTDKYELSDAPWEQACIEQDPAS